MADMHKGHNVVSSNDLTQNCALCEKDFPAGQGTGYASNVCQGCMDKTTVRQRAARILQLGFKQWGGTYESSEPEGEKKV